MMKPTYRSVRDRSLAMNTIAMGNAIQLTTYPIIWTVRICGSLAEDSPTPTTMITAENGATTKAAKKDLQKPSRETFNQDMPDALNKAN